MNIYLFILGILIYCFVCYSFVRIYFLGAVYMHQHFHKAFVHFLLFIWLGIFATTIIAIFLFPAWLSEKLVIFDRSPNTTGALILFGGIVFFISLSCGWFGQEGRKFKDAFKQN